MSTSFSPLSHLQQRKCQFDSGPLQAKRHALRLTVKKELLCCGARAKPKGGETIIAFFQDRKCDTLWWWLRMETKQHCGAPRTAASAVNLTARTSCWPRGASHERVSRGDSEDEMWTKHAAATGKKCGLCVPNEGWL